MKTYVFNNYFSKNRGNNPLKEVIIEASDILEAKNRIKALGMDDMQFECIRVGYSKKKKDITDWQQVRIQAAIAFMQGMMSNSLMNNNTNEELAVFSVNAADALIKKLKGE